MKKTITALIAAAAILFGSVFGICGAVSGSISILSGEKLTTDFDIHETELYKEVVRLTAEYEKELTKAISKKAKEIRDDHMEWVAHSVQKTHHSTGEPYWTTEYRWECTVDVYETTYRLNSTCFYAYMSVTNPDLLSGKQKNYRPTKKDIKKVYDRITKIKADISEDGKNYYVYNQVASAGEAKQIFFPEDEIQQAFYQTSYDQFYCMIGDELDYGDGFLDGTVEDLVAADPNRMGIPLYLQYQSPWGNIPYGGGTIATSGCGPTCLAMVTSYLTESEVYPSDIAAWAGNTYYVPGVGSSWGIYPAAARHWNLSCQSISLSVEIISRELSAGHPVIMSMGPGTFTKSGHFIVLSGIDEDGRIYVNDPNDNDRKKFHEKTFDLPGVIAEGRAAWSFHSY